LLEDRRCRKVVAILLTTVIILSFSVQTVYAAPNDSGNLNFNPFTSFKNMVLSDLTYLKSFLFKDPWNNPEETAYQEPAANDIDFVVTNPDSELKTQTQRALRTAAPSRNVGGTGILPDDLELLARIINAEARGESFEGKVAVGAVVLNRVQHPGFPKSIREVVYQPGQFTAVTDKQINLLPDDSAYRAAEAALEGQDPSKGAIYYYNPKLATDPWIKKRSVVCNIGNHRFCV